ncbi:hypothetical protein CSAL01_00120 [Colletotrichum salicis]|uniref:Uncharacterized protein n=1 Tax=Colletotrichum salicis TaxID=1209931 RepID=A0A135V8B8_9PEZI|nr:hypothetical protein CSAL01_00120 [Colletotrichum salicis]
MGYSIPPDGDSSLAGGVAPAPILQIAAFASTQMGAKPSEHECSYRWALGAGQSRQVPGPGPAHLTSPHRYVPFLPPYSPPVFPVRHHFSPVASPNFYTGCYRLVVV